MGSDDGVKTNSNTNEVCCGCGCGRAKTHFCLGPVQRLWQGGRVTRQPLPVVGCNNVPTWWLQLAAVTASFLMVCYYNNICGALHILPPPEILFTDTFDREDGDYRSGGGALLPPRCRETARRLDQCQRTTASPHHQQQQHHATMSSRTVVFGCHRKWCRSFGHCDPCSGIGDRMRFLLSQVEVASCAVGRVQLDFPVAGLQTLQSAVYTDPSGWLGELLHQRSYHVDRKKPPPYQELIEQQQKQAAATRSIAGGGSDGHHHDYYFTHFTPDWLLNENYDACYFHALFRPDQSLQADLNRHNAAITNASIGIHYRTGDTLAFGIANADNRVSSAAATMEGWEKMKECAMRLAKRLFPSVQPSSQITFYLATDNPIVKENVRQQQQLRRNDEVTIYLTDGRPDSYLRGNSGDREAWLELYLLAARQGLVANLQLKNYSGTADRLSTFAVLAKKIGFLQDYQFMECSLE